MEDIGDSLFSLSINRSWNSDSNTGVDPASPMTRTIVTLPRNATMLAIREEDLQTLSETLEHTLDGADKILQGLEADRELLPSAILRKCHEFADGIGYLAEELEGQSAGERTRLAEAIREDLRLFEKNGDEEEYAHRSSRELSFYPTSSAYGGRNGERMGNNGNDTIVEGNSAISEGEDDDILRAISGASNLLRDVEAAFRDIGNDEAEDIADAALIMARLFLLSLQNIHLNLLEQLTPDNRHDFERDNAMGSKYNQDRSTVRIEELSSDYGNVGTDRKGRRPIGEGGRKKPRGISHQQWRMRVLWPPLGPKIDTAMTWTREEATKRPLLAVALGLTLWPVAISTALIGTSVSLIDAAAQSTYDRFREGPWISVVEENAAQAYQAGRLTVATGKLVGKQSLKVMARQIERRGGLQPIVQDIGGMTLDRITHPVDTIGKIWDGFLWGFCVMKDATEDFLSMRQEAQESLM